MGEQPRIASLEDEVKKVSSREEEKKVAAEHSVRNYPWFSCMYDCRGLLIE